MTQDEGGKENLTGIDGCGGCGRGRREDTTAWWSVVTGRGDCGNWWVGVTTETQRCGDGGDWDGQWGGSKGRHSVVVMVVMDDGDWAVAVACGGGGGRGRRGDTTALMLSVDDDLGTVGRGRNGEMGSAGDLRRC